MSSVAPGEPVLSAEETDALLAAMKSKSLPASAEVTSTDLTSRQGALQRTLAQAEKQIKPLLDAVRRLVLTHAGCSGLVEISPLDVIANSPATEGLVPGAVAVPFHIVQAGDGLALLGPELVTFLLERRLGAPLPLEEAGEKVAVRTEFSKVDRRLLRPVVEDFVTSIKTCLPPGLGELRCADSVFILDELPNFAKHGPFLRMSVQIKIGTILNDTILFAFTPDTALALYPMPVLEDAPTKAEPNEQARLAARLMSAEIEVVAILGRVESSVGNLLALSVGDVVRLDDVPENPISIFVEGISMIRGLPGVSHGNLAVTISHITP